MLIHLGLLFIWLLNTEAQFISMQSIIDHIHEPKVLTHLELHSETGNELESVHIEKITL